MPAVPKRRRRQFDIIVR